MQRYNLGCGKKKKADWFNVDLFENPDHQWDLGKFPWPYNDGDASEVLASHILEHFYKKDAWRFLSECHRIMRVGAVLHIAVPDMDKFINAHLSKDFEPFNGYKWRDLNHLLGGDEREKNEYHKHKYMYNYETLAYMLRQVGFLPTKRIAPMEFDNPEYIPISLYVDAAKLP